MNPPRLPSNAEPSVMPDCVTPPVLGLRRSVLVLVAVCVAIALLLYSLYGGSLGANLVYSFAVGSCCWLLTELLRSGALALKRRWRASRGLPPTHPRALSLSASVPLHLLAVLAGAPLGLTIGDTLTGLHSPSLLSWQSPMARLTIVISVIASALILYIVTTMERLANARAEAEAAQRRATEMQLKLLESQLEPHMLFNTLANLRVLIGLDPPRAQAMLDRLIAFLRATLDASRTGSTSGSTSGSGGDSHSGSRSDSHTLAAEFERVADYLALMAMRMGPRLVVKLDLPAELRGASVPPLLLQPLVENSIRHGLEPKVTPGRIEVSASRYGPRLLLTVRDTGVGLSDTTTTAGTRFGLEQVRARLHALYGPRASLSLGPGADVDGGTVAQVSMPLMMPSAKIEA